MSVALGAARVLVCVALLASCGSTSPHPVPGGASFERDDFRFVAPTGWQVRSSTEVSFGASRRVVYLANQELRDDCAEEATGVTCSPPIDGGLRPGAMLVTWVVRSCVARGCDLPPGRLITIGNRQGVNAPMDAGCPDIGSTEISAWHVSVTPQRVDVLMACSRDPSDGTRAAFLGFLDAIRWRIP
ncbi:MAG: hypothetical protein WD116_03945 [Chloroflexota bacterium]